MPVNTRHKEYDKFSAKWKRCRDTASGQDAIHSAGESYLPKLGGQEDDEYAAYKLRASFYAATTRTIDGLSGMLFRKPPETVLPTVIEPYEDDVTRDGLSLQNFAEQGAEQLLQVGRGGILVDHPPGAAVITQAAAQDMRLRPYLRMYTAESIINWKITDGILTMVVLEEIVDDVVDEYKSDDVTQWRVLDLFNGQYRQRTYRKGEKKDEFVQVGNDIFPLMRGNRLKYIPFVFMGVRDSSPSIDMPPLMPLVDTNLSHYRSSADYEHGLHWCGCPTPVITGYTLDDGKRLSIGSGEAWVLPAADAKATILELKADSLGALQIALERKEGQMAALGARMLSPEKKAAEAADTAAIHRGGESSVLASIAMALSASISRAMQIMTEWAGSSEEARIDINRDYLPTGMSAQDLTARVQAWQGGAISHEELYDQLVAGEVITEKEGGFEAEKERIAENPPGMNMGGEDGA